MKKVRSELVNRQVSRIEARLRRIAEELEPLYDEVDRLSDEASKLVRERSALLEFEYESVEGSKRPRLIQGEFATDPFTVTIRTFGHQRRLTLRSCSRAFSLHRVAPHLVNALAEIGLEMDADECNVSTVSEIRWDEGVAAALEPEA